LKVNRHGLGVQAQIVSLDAQTITRIFSWSTVPARRRGNDQVLTSAQLKAARALVGFDQRALAQAAGVSLPTIQRMEASDGNVRGVVDTLMKVMSALEAAGVEFINEGAVSHGGGRGVRLRDPRGAR